MRIKSRFVAVIAAVLATIVLLGYWGFNSGQSSALPTGLRSSPRYEWPDMHMVLTAKGLLTNPHADATYEYFRSGERQWKLIVVESEYDDEIGDSVIFDGENVYRYRPNWMKEPGVDSIGPQGIDVSGVLRPGFANLVSRDLENDFGRIIGNKEIAGYMAIGVERSGVNHFDGTEYVERVWIEPEHGIPMKYEMFDNGELTAYLEVISLTINALLPEDIFEPVF